MSQHHLQRSMRPHQGGFSLVELMVAITISVILLAGVVQIYTSSRQVYQVQDALSRVQENGRFAEDFLSRDIRHAAYAGCAKRLTLNNIQDKVSVIANADGNAVADFTAPDVLGILTTHVQGFDDAIAPAWVNPTGIAQVAGTDVLTINHAADLGVELTAAMATTAAPIPVRANFAVGTTMMVTDCKRADIFTVTDVPPAVAGVFSIGHTGMQNINGGNLANIYEPPAQLLLFGGAASTTYFIGVNPAGNPALYRVVPGVGGPDVQELIEGVANMQVLYGEDLQPLGSAGFGTADRFLEAGTAGLQMNRVVSVRVSLLVRTTNNISGNNVALGDQTYSYNGNPAIGNDGILRRVFTTTIALRNRAP